MEQITASQAFALLNEHKANGMGKVFSVSFAKKDGSHRDMQCRFGVKSYLKGGTWANGTAGKPSDHALAIVYDMANNGYRSIPINRLHRLKLNKQEFKVIQD